MESNNYLPCSYNRKRCFLFQPNESRFRDLYNQLRHLHSIPRERLYIVFRGIYVLYLEIRTVSKLYDFWIQWQVIILHVNVLLCLLWSFLFNFCGIFMVYFLLYIVFYPLSIIYSWKDKIQYIHSFECIYCILSFHL